MPHYIGKSDSRIPEFVLSSQRNPEFDLNKGCTYYYYYYHPNLQNIGRAASETRTGFLA
jgi:hypothetical protein